MDIEKLYEKSMRSDEDLYSFLEKELPDLSIEDRLKVMASILNDYLESYEYDQKEKLKREEYSITKFKPKR